MGVILARTAVSLRSLALAATAAIAPSAAAWAQPVAPVQFGGAESFAVLAAHTVANTGTSLVGGDAGVGPGGTITNLPLTMLSPGSSLHDGDAVAAQALRNARSAWTVLAARACPVLNRDLGAGRCVAGGRRLLLHERRHALDNAHPHGHRPVDFPGTRHAHDRCRAPRSSRRWSAPAPAGAPTSTGRSATATRLRRSRRPPSALVPRSSATSSPRARSRSARRHARRAGALDRRPDGRERRRRDAQRQHHLCRLQLRPAAAHPHRVQGHRRRQHQRAVQPGGDRSRRHRHRLCELRLQRQPGTPATGSFNYVNHAVAANLHINGPVTDVDVIALNDDGAPKTARLSGTCDGFLPACTFSRRDRRQWRAGR